MLVTFEVGSTNNSQVLLSLAARVLLLLTIFFFLSLSIVSGRVLSHQYVLQCKRLPYTLSLASPIETLEGVTPADKIPYSSVPEAPVASVNVVGGSESALMEEEGAAAASTGFEMRQRFFLLLFMASTLRVCSLVTEVVMLETMTALPSTSVYCRLLALFLWLPSMLFASMNSLVLLFWAQLCYACWGKAYPWPRRVFFLFNLLLYVGFVLLCGLTTTSAGLWKGCDLLQGCVYFVGLFVILYYSIQLINFFRKQSPDEDFFFDLSSAAIRNGNGITGRQEVSSLSVSAVSPRQLVLRRITAVCILFCVLFTVKAVYLIGIGTGYMESEESQDRTPLVRYYLFSRARTRIRHPIANVFARHLQPRHPLLCLAVATVRTTNVISPRRPIMLTRLFVVLHHVNPARKMSFQCFRGINIRQHNEHTGRLAAQYRPLQQTSAQATSVELTCSTALVEVHLPVKAPTRT
ncbi:unnamed protein product [Peronospora belbahrii]|uniref:THH1/TOM1/TOM3 domain-containing protein n=1 Tax=Peronospora belbahrii TaxID=622444 RepID=A0AAU9L553_9STRA|nr:unnamed protein product [Peronospora belbahrii]